MNYNEFWTLRSLENIEITNQREIALSLLYQLASINEYKTKKISDDYYLSEKDLKALEPYRVKRVMMAAGFG